MKVYYIIFRLPNKGTHIEGVEIEAEDIFIAIKKACEIVKLTDQSILSIILL